MNVWRSTTTGLVLATLACQDVQPVHDSSGEVGLSAALAGLAAESDTLSLRVTNDGALPSLPIQGLHVLVPATANGPMRIEEAHGVSISVRLSDATVSPIRPAQGLAVFPDATASGETLAWRATPSSIEDHLELARARDVTYELELSSGVRGLRQIGDVLEIVDAAGAPRIRMLQPIATDSAGARYVGRLSVAGCEVDRDPRAPWGRSPVAPGAPSCRLTISLPNVAGPVVLDPAWTATSTMTTRRHSHTATRLADGRVLLVGGATFEPLDTAEIYDETSNTFAATGKLAAVRSSHVATLMGDERVLIAGGYTTVSGSTVEVRTAEIYSPVTGQFTSTPSAVALGGPDLAFQEDGTGRPLLVDSVGGKAEAFTLPSGPFTQRFVTPRGVSVSTADGQIAFVSAMDAKITGFDPDTGSQAVLGTLASAVQHQAATNDAQYVRAIYNGNRTLTAVVGTCPDEPCGFYTSTPTRAEVFDLDLQTSELVPLADYYFLDHALALVAPGRVLVINSQRPASAGLRARTETILTEYASAIPSAEMQYGRGRAALVSLASGSVLVSGGRPSDLQVGASTSDIFSLVASGSTAADQGECASFMINDGVCCDSPCSGACRTCSVGTGACAEVRGVTDPGTCDGARRCSLDAECLLQEGQSCSAASACASGHCADGVCCDTACTNACESCVRAESIGQCGPVVGAPAAGHGACEGSGACVGVCDGLAASCTYPDQNSECGSTCAKAKLTPSACDGAGSCIEVDATRCAGGFVCADDTACLTSCISDDDCVSGRTCDAGACHGALGSACDSTDDCASGFCVDGVCCDSECEGQCEACDGRTNAGRCSAVTGEPHGARDACAAADPGCESTCDGVDTAACTFADRSRICGTECSDDQLVLSSCDGLGNCVAAPSRPCAGDFTCTDAKACRSTCRDDRDCRSGFSCEAATGRCRAKPIRCEGDAVIDSAGIQTSCAPFRCINASCASPCSTSEDCTTGYVCGDGQCVLTPAAPAEDSSGCALAARGSGRFGLLVVLGIAFASLRRRRSRAGSGCSYISHG